MASLNNLAFCLKQVGRIGRVEAYFVEALAVATELGNLRWQAVIAQDLGLFLMEQGQMQKAEHHIREGLRLAVSLDSQADIAAGLLAMARWQAQIGHLYEALTAAGYVVEIRTGTAETQAYAADFWEELAGELPPVFTERARAKIKNATFDDIMEMVLV
jgi:hypothetical protein